VHHRPAGSPRSAGVPGAPNRGTRPRRPGRRRATRLAVGMALSTAVTGFVLAAPVVSTGPAASSMSLDASSSSSTPSSSSPSSSSSSAVAPVAENTSPVVMGRDGPATTPPPADVPSATEESGTTAGSSADGPATPADVPATTSSSPGTTVESPESTAPATSASTTSAGVIDRGLEGEVLAMVNTARATAGCDPLVADEGLATVARAHSADMRDRDFFDHVNPDDLDPSERGRAAGRTNVRAENISYGQSTAAAVMDAWLNSSGHRENILDCDLRTLGVGIAEGPGGPWWTQVFGD
jgi:uncharacterized protein YkwD